MSDSRAPAPPERSPRSTPAASSAAVSAAMRAARVRDTGPELAIRTELFARGLRYRIHRRPLESLRSEADVVFPRERVAVYVDGCFWHRCPDHGVMPKANATWWRDKLDANVERDRRADRLLTAAGWVVVRVWEHESPVVAATRIEIVVRAIRTGGTRGAPLPG
ncbi:MAG: very short patch repair endonuclease [Solirubrobacteraceae bacterium]